MASWLMDSVGALVFLSLFFLTGFFISITAASINAASRSPSKSHSHQGMLLPLLPLPPLLLARALLPAVGKFVGTTVGATVGAGVAVGGTGI